MIKNITDSIKYIGVDDYDIDLFESQYIVPNGMAYNSYIIEDEQITILDTADARKGEEWWQNLTTALDGREPSYLIVHHAEPDHSSLIAEAMKKYPAMRIVATPKAIQMMPQFFEGIDFASRSIAVKEGDTLTTGKHTLQFLHAPMVHWPEVMVTFDTTDKVLFSADAFGKFGALATDEPWACEARRYYFNICGKYGVQVQTLLKKVAALPVEIICPLHGPVLTENLGYYVGLYDTWSKYEPETEGVFVAYASIHGGTGVAAHKLAEMLTAAGAPKVAVTDLSRCDLAEAVEDAFRYSHMVLCASSYDAGVFTPMADFLHHLKSKNFQRRKVALLENGSWAPTAGRVMRSMLEEMKAIEIVEPMVTIRSRMKESDLPAMQQLAEELLK